jgi:hypothetical protein
VYAGAVLQLASSASARRTSLPGCWTPVREMLPPAVAKLPGSPSGTS